MTSRCGWGLIACNLTPAKLTCSGVPLHVDNLSRRVFHLGQALTSSVHQNVHNLGNFFDADLTSAQLATLIYILQVTSRPHAAVPC